VTEPWAQDLLAAVGAYRGPSAPAPAGGDDDVAGYIRQAASKRGIDPEIAIRVAQSEGGLVPNRTGVFKTGQSFWPFQLHYGGPGYEKFGNVAGMGNSFTAQTGYQPGDPSAWRAATDYALDAAQKQGWGAWYGARNVGITGRQGIGNAPATNPVTDRSGGAEPWAQDLLAAVGSSQPPTPLPSRGAVQAAPAGSGEPWAEDLLRVAGPGATGSVPSASRGGESYAGPAQTDEVWPVAGQRWGAVNNPFGGNQARSAGATVALPSRNVGADLTAQYGAQVVAPVSGTVVEVFDAPDERDRNANHGWGGMTLLRGDNGYYYRMSHARPGSIATRPGQRVAQGEPLQQVGVSGNTTGAHLDYEKFDRPGNFVDPVATAGRAAGAVGSAVSGAAQTAGAWVDDLLRSAGAR